MRDLSRAHRLAILFPSATADKIFEWFKKSTQEGSHVMGSLFTGIYYFDASFWPVYVPIGYGVVRLDSIAALETMPQNLKDQLCGDRAELWNYVLFWADCVDLGYGGDDLRKIAGVSTEARTFLENGRREIDAAISQLSSSHPNPKAIMSARLAAEIFFKALLIERKNGVASIFLTFAGSKCTVDLVLATNAGLQLAAQHFRTPNC
jgi:hypothetical protein